jgi:hypothetical protein
MRQQGKLLRVKQVENAFCMIDGQIGIFDSSLYLFFWT